MVMNNIKLNYLEREVVFCDLDKNDSIEHDLCNGKWWEENNVEFIKNLEVNGNYLDVGAYIGTYSIFFSLFCPCDVVYAIEPQSDIYKKLLTNLFVNNIKNCITKNVAVSDRFGKGVIYNPGIIEVPRSMRGAAWLYEKDNIWNDKWCKFSDTDIVTLDSLELKNIKLMKVDVEGKILNVLRGGIKTLKTVEHLFVEMWPKSDCISHNFEYQEPEILDFLDKQGFVNVNIDKSICTDTYFIRK
jgi:FkbM family methyltransferase